MSTDDGRDVELELDLSNLDIPDDPAELFRLIEAERAEHPDPEPAEGAVAVDDDAIRLPDGFDSWTLDARVTWAYDTDVLRSEAKERRLLYAAWLALHPERDPDRRTSEPTRPVWADVAAILDGRMQAPAPDGGPHRTDGARILYRGKVNGLIGDPESAKTLLALAVLADGLGSGSVGVFIDTDHNGAEFVLRTLLALGVPRDALVARLHYAEPDDRDELLRTVEVAGDLPPGVVVLDSVGEMLGLWGVSPNDDQGVLEMNRATAARLAKLGHLVITIDHLAKNTDSRKYGATGSTAKLRAANGAVYEVAVVDEFSPDDGGKSALLLKKDRNGGVRALGYKRDETVALFELSAPDAATGQQTATLHPGSTISGAAAKAAAKAAALAADVAALAALTPPAASKDDVRLRLGWGSARALDALRAWRAQTSGSQP
jgi:hypothetical protein